MCQYLSIWDAGTTTAVMYCCTWYILFWCGSALEVLLMLFGPSAGWDLFRFFTWWIRMHMKTRTSSSNKVSWVRTSGRNFSGHFSSFFLARKTNRGSQFGNIVIGRIVVRISDILLMNSLTDSWKIVSHVDTLIQAQTNYSLAAKAHRNRARAVPKGKQSSFFFVCCFLLLPLDIFSFSFSFSL